MIQSVIMWIITALCLASAVLWCTNGAYAAAFSFVGFALGYAGLALLFGGVL